MKAFIESQFNYCPLIWILRSRTLKNKINHIHERALRTVYSDYNPSFYELLDKDDTFTIHQKNVQNLAIEIYKYLHGLSPAILSEVFKVNETIPYDLRMRNELYARNPKTVRYGTETISFLSPKIWSLIPQNIKDSGSLPCFKKTLENGNPTAHVVYAKHFCNMLVLYSSTEVLSSQFSVYLKFIYLFIFILHIISKNYIVT